MYNRLGHVTHQEKSSGQKPQAIKHRAYTKLGAATKLSPTGIYFKIQGGGIRVGGHSLRHTHQAVKSPGQPHTHTPGRDNHQLGMYDKNLINDTSNNILKFM